MMIAIVMMMMMMNVMIEMVVMITMTMKMISVAPLEREPESNEGAPMQPTGGGNEIYLSNLKGRFKEACPSVIRGHP